MNSLPCNQSAERNKKHIIPLLETLLGKSGRIVEVASGTGQPRSSICQQKP